jgi:hypothetical protein
VTTLTITSRLVTTTCASCAIVFAVPEQWDNERREDHKGFYCPNGHSLVYKGESEAEKLQRQLDAERARVDMLRQETKRQKATIDAERRSHAATKGQLTKTKKRVAGGVCPCCDRSFVQLARHMSTQHPDYTATQETPL